MESSINTQQQAERSRGNVARILIPQPMAATSTDGWNVPRPRDYKDERIQVTAHATDENEVVERWCLSETDVRWYRIEIDGKPVAAEKKAVVGEGV